jgi:putative ABC transport system substrate-binding protein
MKAATTLIPLVIWDYDPLGRGLTKSLAHPGGNITGVAGDLDPSIWGKRAKSQRLAICSPSFAAQRSGLLANPYGFPL